MNEYRLTDKDGHKMLFIADSAKIAATYAKRDGYIVIAVEKRHDWSLGQAQRLLLEGVMERRFFQLLEMSLMCWDRKQNFVNLMLSFRSKAVPVDKLLTKGKIKQLLNETVTDILLNGQPNMKL